jgi:hypothetical protein
MSRKPAAERRQHRPESERDHPAGDGLSQRRSTLADLNIIDVMRLAMLQAALAEYPATGHVLHPTDWASIETLKDDGEGRYIIGNPQGSRAAHALGACRSSPRRR